MEMIRYWLDVLVSTLKVWERGDMMGNAINALAIAAFSIFAITGLVDTNDPHVKHGIEIVSGGVFLFVFLLVSPYRLWSAEKRRADNLQEAARPKLRCSFGDHIPGCVRPNTTLIFQSPNAHGVMESHAIKGTYYRIYVEATGIGSIPQCSARIPWIKRNGRDWFDGENLIMPFVPAENPNCDKKDIVGGAPELIDMLFIAENNSIMITTKEFKIPTSINYQEMLSHNGEYLFHLDISSPASAPISHEIKLIWTGDHRTARVLNS